ncbi:MAG: TRL domain-containing protein [Chloroherpetonaceae bacterium]|nr:TRL domain-containing protein [Chloroherpetonaceae bacterium]
MKHLPRFTFVLIISFLLCLTSCTTTLPVAYTGNPIGTKVGKTINTRYCFFFFSNPNFSVLSAAKEAGITKISSVEISETTAFLGFIQTYTLIVTGE